MKKLLLRFCFLYFIDPTIYGTSFFTEQTAFAQSKTNTTDVKKYLESLYAAIKSDIKINQKPTKMHDFVIDAARKVQVAIPDRVQSLLLHLVEQAIPYTTIKSSDIITQDFVTRTSLEWCECFHEPFRIMLAAEVVLDIEHYRPNKTTQLVYTSLGSGGLLQDYITILALIKSGYSNIGINLIDIEYPESTSIPKTHISRKEAHSKARKENDFISMIGLEHIEHIEDFSALLAAYCSIHAPMTNLAIAHFPSSSDYLAQLSKNPDLHSDIVTLIDPNFPGFFETKYCTTAMGIALKMPRHTSIATPPIKANNQLYIFVEQDQYIIYSNINEFAPEDFKKMHDTLVTESNITTSLPNLYEKGIEFYQSLPVASKKMLSLYYVESAHLALQKIVKAATKAEPIIYTAHDLTTQRNSWQKINPTTFSTAQVLQDTVGKNLERYGYTKTVTPIRQSTAIALQQ